MKKVNEEYVFFKKKFMEETGITDEGKAAQLMSQLKRAEGRLHRIYVNERNTGEKNEELEKQIQQYVINLLKHFKTIKVYFNSDPRGGAIRMMFKRTEWFNTLGSDVSINW